MKKRFFIFAACSLLLLAAGCKNDSNEPKIPSSLSGDVARPTWTAPSEYDYTYSMTAVVKADIKAQYPTVATDYVLKEEDLLGAFVGETCLGVIGPKEGLFFLYISGMNDSTAIDQPISLRYYSAQYKNIFEAKDIFSFKNDAKLGTVAEPVTPAFVLVKK